MDRVERAHPLNSCNAAATLRSRQAGVVSVQYFRPPKRQPRFNFAAPLADSSSISPPVAMSHVLGSEELKRAIQEVDPKDPRNSEPWWMVDLGVSTQVDQVVVYGRSDYKSDRLKGFSVALSETDAHLGSAVACPGQSLAQDVPLGGSTTVFCKGALGRYLFVKGTNGKTLELCEVTVTKYVPLSSQPPPPPSPEDPQDLRLWLDL